MKFERPKPDNVAGNWVYRNLPKCPFCKLSSQWEIATKWMGKGGWKRYHFRCSNLSCLVILSIPAPVVESTGGIALKAGLIGVVVKKAAPNQLLMEDAGNNEKAKNYVGTEFSLETG